MLVGLDPIHVKKNKQKTKNKIGVIIRYSCNNAMRFGMFRSDLYLFFYILRVYFIRKKVFY
jgi:hypothetical protein